MKKVTLYLLIDKPLTDGDILHEMSQYPGVKPSFGVFETEEAREKVIKDVQSEGPVGLQKREVTLTLD